MDDDWLAVLADECKATSQAATARRLGVSPTTINQVLKKSYPGDMERIESLVRGELMGKLVTCPVIGEIPLKRCLEHQARKFAPTNPMRVQLYHACRSGCKNSKIK